MENIIVIFLIAGLALTNINLIPHYKIFENKIFSNVTKMLKDSKMISFLLYLMEVLLSKVELKNKFLKKFFY